MQWLIQDSLKPAAAAAMVEHGHVTHLLSEVDASPDLSVERILEIAAQKQWDVLTSDPALSRAPFETPSKFNRSIVFLQATEESEQVDAIGRLFTRYARLSPGRLYTVTKSRVKIRQLPTPKPLFKREVKT